MWPKSLGKTKIYPNNILVQKNFWSKEVLSKKCLSTKLRPQKLGPKSLVKIRSVTAEIMLFWTNVARTYVAELHDSWHLLKNVPETYL